ncbi:MAG: BON domain-containing protein [Gammaproteobacteria bacterium]
MKIGHVTLLGCLAFSLVCWFAITSGAGRIQEQIADDVTAVLSEARFDDVEVRVDGRAVMLLGAVPTGAARAHAELSVRGLPSVKRVINRLELNASENDRRRRAAPYQLIVSLSDTNVVFSGLVASEESRSSLRAIAEKRYSSVDLVDDLRVEPNVRDEWGDAAGSILSALIVLPKVHVELTDAEVFVTGQALTSTDRDSVAEQVRAALPYGVTFRYDVNILGE